VFGARRACDREDGGRDVAEPPTPGKRASRRSRECEPDRERVDCVGSVPLKRELDFVESVSAGVVQVVTGGDENEPSDGQKTTIDE
jgi:hypothetical protein